MKQGTFALLGYDNPLGRYPAPVVPVGRLGTELVAVYADDESTSYVTLEGDAQYLEFDAGTLKHFVDFDPRLDRLFAISSSDVRRYPIKNEQKVFSNLLKQESFSYDNPFLRLSLAKVTNDLRLIVWELTSCVLWMLKSAPELADSWYEGQLGSLKDCMPYSIFIAIPHNWRDLPSIPKSIKSRRMDTVSGVERLYGSKGARVSSYTAFIALVIWSILFAIGYVTPRFLEEVANWVFILAGIVLTHVLFLYSQFYRESQGYMFRAARKIWLFLFEFFTIQWAVGALCFYLALSFLWSSVPRSLLAFIIGVTVAAIRTALESMLLPKGGTKTNTIRMRLIRSLLRLNLALRHYFESAIESCREQDLFDCQQPNAWGLDLSPIVVGKRIRKLYEFYKDQIAEERNDPSLLRYDVGRTPWDMFRVLVRHIGRNRLREYLKNPSTPSVEWDGRERRRVVGTKSDRDKTLDPNPRRSRRYDEQIAGRPKPTDQQDEE